MKLSAKKQGELYNQVYQDVMSARLEIYKITSGQLREQIDNILFRLITKAPENAVKVFNPIEP